MTEQRPNPRTARIALTAALALLGIGPLLYLTLLSLSGGWFWPDLLPAQLAAEPWRALAGEGGGGRLIVALRNSLIIGSGTGAAAAAIGLPLGRMLARLRGPARHLGVAAAFLPVTAPPVMLGVGLHLSFVSSGLGGSIGGVLLAHLVPALGYTTLFFLGLFTLYDDRPELEARTLGASAAQVFARVTLPRLRRPLLEAALLGFLISWAQVPLTLLVGQGLVSTLAVEVIGFIRSGQDAFAAAAGLLLTLPGAALLLTTAFAIRRVGAVGP